MAAHWIGIKKIKRFSVKTGILFIAGVNISGTKLYRMLSIDNVLYLYDYKNNICDLHPFSDLHAYYISNLKSRYSYLKKYYNEKQLTNENTNKKTNYFAGRVIKPV